MNEVFPLEREVEAYESMMSGKVRFSAVLTTTGHQGFESITIVLLCLLCVVANKLGIDSTRIYADYCLLDGTYRVVPIGY